MVTIYGRADRLNPIKARLSDVLHRCFVEVLGLPADKRAHRFVPMDASDFYYPGGRSDAYTAITINMIAGRTRETLKRLIHTIFDACERELGLSPIDVEITITEQPAHCWGFRGMTGDEAMPGLSYKIDV
jgi:phenylpyruvate tautomerase PptA (4-oxalocrotonate tautomerase family)